jgi:hypothetical protein
MCPAPVRYIPSVCLFSNGEILVKPFIMQSHFVQYYIILCDGNLYFNIFCTQDNSFSKLYK